MRRPRISVATLCLLSLALIDGRAAVARVGASIVVKEIIDTTRNDAGQAISLPHGPLQLVASIYTIAPGARLPEHKHPFQRYAYVLQGDLRVEQIGSGSKIYHAGEFIAEGVDRWHFGEAVGQSEKKLLVIDQLPPGRNATIRRPRTP